MGSHLSECVMHLEFHELDFKPAEIARPNLNAAAIEKYGRLYEDGADVRAATVFYDGDVYWGADGRHREQGARIAEKKSIKCLVRDGSYRDALLHAFNANAEHGVPLTDSDIRRNVERMLEDDDWGQWPTKRIAEHCGCSQRWVQRIKQERADKALPSSPTEPLISNPGTAISKPRAVPCQQVVDDGDVLGETAHELLGKELAAEMSEMRQSLLRMKKQLEQWQADPERHHLVMFRLPDEIGRAAWALEEKKPLGTCPACDGSGDGSGDYNGRKCKWCQGTGFFDRRQKHERKGEVHFSTAG